MHYNSVGKQTVNILSGQFFVFKKFERVFEMLCLKFSRSQTPLIYLCETLHVIKM